MEEETKKETISVEESVLNAKAMDRFLPKILFGFLFGLAIVIPGISGAAIAIMFALYDKLLYAVSNIFKHFKKCFMFLLPVVLGLIIGFTVGFFLVQKLLALIPFSVILLFLGLMAGAFPIVKDEIKDEKRDWKGISLAILGILIPLSVGGIVIALNYSSIIDGLNNGTSSLLNNYAGTSISTKESDIALTNSFFGDFPIWTYLFSLPIGIMVGATQVIPGLSASAFLMMIGWYKPLMGSVHITYLFDNPLMFVIIGELIVGFLAGFFLISKLMDFLLKKNRGLTYFLIVGLSFGSIMSMLLNPEIFEIYMYWTIVGLGEKRALIDLIIGIPLLAAGFISSYLLVRFERKKSMKA